jgi:hypothetical protein
LISAKATSIKPAKVSAADKILDNFTKREQEALEEYYRKKLSVNVGRSTSSKTLGVISDMHVGSTTALYSGYGPAKITSDQEKIRDWWLHCSDKIGKCDLLLLNGEPVEGTHYKSNAYELWSASIADQCDDAERLVKQWHYDKLLLTRGSKYHSQDGHTSYEEILARKMGAVQYQGTFGKGLSLLQNQKQLLYNAYSGDYTDMYAFFSINSKLFLASHEIGFSKQKASRTGAISRALVNMELERGKWYDINRNLDCLIHSHNHYYIHVEFATPPIGIISPCFKMPDSYLFHGNMATYPDIGAVQVIVEPNSDLQIKKHIMPRERLPKPRILKI